MDEFCEADMDDWFCQFNMAEVSGAGGGGVAAGLALLARFKGSESSVHQPGYNWDAVLIVGVCSLNFYC